MKYTAATAVLSALFLAACGGGREPIPVPNNPPVVSSVPPCVAKAVVEVALVGDSTMYGMGGRIQPLMDARFGIGRVHVVNYGVSGTRSYQAPEVTAADVKVGNYGINDMRDSGATPDVFRTHMALLDLTLVETQNPQVWGKGIEGGHTAADYDELGFVGVSRTLGVPVADTYAYVLGLQNWQDLVGDGVHPTDELYDLIAKNVLAPAIGTQVAPLLCAK